MEKEVNQIDSFYRKEFQNYSQKASVYTWSRMRWRLLWLNYSRYIVGFVVVIFLGVGTYLGIELLGVDQQISGKNESSIQNESGNTFQNQETNNEKQSAFLVEDLDENINSISENEIVTQHYETPGLDKEGILKKHSEISIKSTKNEINPVDNDVVKEKNEFLFEETVVTNLSGLSFRERDNNINRLKAQTIVLLNSPVEIQDYKTAVEIEKKDKWFSVGINISTLYNIPSLKAADGYNDHVQYRNDHESVAVSISPGLEFRFNIKNWFVQTGLSYSKFKQNRNYNNSFIALDSLNSYYQTDTIYGWVFDPPNIGESIILGYDTTFVPVYNNINEGYNQWSYLEIPLIAGYKYNLNRLSFEIGTGFSCAYLIQAKGNVPHLNEKNTFTDLADLESDMNKYLFNYLIQVGASYHLTPNWSLNISTLYKQNLNSIFNNNYPIDQRFSSVGINFGLKVDL